MIGRLVSVISGLLIVAALAFGAGMWTSYKGWQPWPRVLELQTAWRSYRATGLFLPPDSFARRPDSRGDARYSVHDAAAMAPGLIAMNRFDAASGVYVYEIIDAEGTVVHRRPIDYRRLVADGKADEFVHIATLLPDGSLLVVFDDAPGMARLDACGDPIWARTDQIYHHSIEPGDDGYWTWASAIWNGGHDQKMLRFDPMTGETLEVVDLIDDVIGASPSNRLAFEVPEGFKLDRDLPQGSVADIFHPNDVKPLRAAVASAFPDFSAGDLLISLRNIDMVAVIDRQTKAVKWAAYGPWQHQHDADFQPDGTITVFSNNTDRFRSSIVEVNPTRGTVRDRFFGTGLRFDSYIMGKQQRLPNGNWLITSTMEGRVIEVTGDGKPVRDFENVINDGYNAVVPYAEYIAPGYLAEIPVCEK